MSLARHHVSANNCAPGAVRPANSRHVQEVDWGVGKINRSQHTIRIDEPARATTIIVVTYYRACICYIERISIIGT